jgi:hypothetical protein
VNVEEALKMKRGELLGQVDELVLRIETIKNRYPPSIR